MTYSEKSLQHIKRDFLTISCFTFRLTEKDPVSHLKLSLREDEHLRLLLSRRLLLLLLLIDVSLNTKREAKIK